MKEGKIILARNMTFCLNMATSNYFSDDIFLDKHTYHPFVKIWNKNSPKKQVYNNYRQTKTSKKSLIGYLNINGLKSKIAYSQWS